MALLIPHPRAAETKKIATLIQDKENQKKNVKILLTNLIAEEIEGRRQAKLCTCFKVTAAI
ncbi:hypothetical protein OIU77_028926 [Salix suchowensis]|uniref:Uncharacterized protein n=1 Tax=Salix suchowensis TaxID=1278906 RepID=A0ABQ9BJ38_9ROSI|nr:hypothetical protein OIU77_028926 [Salix suchowensis]